MSENSGKREQAGTVAATIVEGTQETSEGPHFFIKDITLDDAWIAIPGDGAYDLEAWA